MDKRVYVDADKFETLTIKLCVGRYEEVTFSVEELEKIMVTKLYKDDKWIKLKKP